MEGLYLGPVSSWIDADAFFATVWSLWYQYVPVKSGNMKASCDYEVYGKSAYFWTDCIYSAYQDSQTAYAGWFKEALEHTYQRVLANWTEWIGEDNE